MSPPVGLFEIVPGLRGQECDEFREWLLSFSQQAEIMSSIMLEYEKMRRAGLSRDTAHFMYEDVYETHVAPFEDVRVYFLFVREIVNSKIVSLGQCPAERGEAAAVDLAYRRACTYLGRNTLRGYRL